MKKKQETTTMRINTEQLKALVGKAVNGAGNDKTMPLTQFMGIIKDGENITLITTDATNYFYVHGMVDEDASDINVTVFYEQFAKLISKMTSKEVELEVVDKALHVIGNGDYMIELPLDENGELVTYPDPYNDKYKTDFKWDGEIKVAEIKTVVDSVKPSLAPATVDELPSIKNYFVGDNVIATDRYKIASFDNKMMNKEVLMSARLMDLLSLSENTLNYKIDKDCMVFESDDCTIFSKQMDDIEEYPIDAIESLINEKFASVCKVNKNEFIALLERIALFVGKYDDRAVRLYFEKNGIRVCNKNRKSNEVIEYNNSKGFKEYDCTISVDMLLAQLKAYAGDMVELHYNNDKCIKFVDGSITQIVALMAE